MPAMTTQEFLADIQDALELEQPDMQMTDCFRTYEEWDSLTFLSLVTLLQQEYNLQLNLSTFESIQTWQDLYDLIKD